VRFYSQLPTVWKGKNGVFYRISDPFTAFHLSFADKFDNENYWSSYIDNAGHRAWSGYAFEQVCFSHINEIRRALGISGILTEVSSWMSRNEKKGAQIDLIIDRADRVINLCEIKFSGGLYEIDKDYDMLLRNRTETFRNEIKTKKALRLTMITTYEVKPDRYSGVVQSQVTIDDLI
jgi:hypothetical protein